MLADAPSSSSSSPAVAGIDRIFADFGGTAGEYFRIWLVNSLLTIITVGLYSPWAKVRNKRYFYGSTWLGGANFEYHAKPLAILVARLVLLAVFGGGVVWAGEDIVRNASYSLALLIFLPWAIVRGLSFNARNSSWAEMRFSFRRDYAPVYLIYSPFLIFSALYLGLLIAEGPPPDAGAESPDGAEEIPDSVIFVGLFSSAGVVLLMFLSPFLVRAYHLYKAKGHKLGNLRFYLQKPPVSGYYGAIVLPYFVAPLFGMLTAAVMILIVVVLFAGNREEAGGIGAFMGFGIIALSYLVAALAVKAMLFRLFWDNLRARMEAKDSNGGNDAFEARFVCQMNIWHFAFRILLVNALATVFSLGLLHPWAKVRYTKYLVRHIHIIAPSGALAFLTAKGGKEESAFGEELDVAEGFDFDVGLI